jgi:hypothetical protein
VYNKALAGVDRMGGRERSNKKQEELMVVFPVPLEDSD